MSYFNFYGAKWNFYGAKKKNYLDLKEQNKTEQNKSKTNLVNKNKYR